MFPINHIKVGNDIYLIWFLLYSSWFQKEFKAAKEFKEDI